MIRLFSSTSTIQLLYQDLTGLCNFEIFPSNGLRQTNYKVKQNFRFTHSSAERASIVLNKFIELIESKNIKKELVIQIPSEIEKDVNVSFKLTQDQEKMFIFSVIINGSVGTMTYSTSNIEDLYVLKKYISSWNIAQIYHDMTNSGNKKKNNNYSNNGGYNNQGNNYQQNNGYNNSYNQSYQNNNGGGYNNNYRNNGNNNYQQPQQTTNNGNYGNTANNNPQNNNIPQQNNQPQQQNPINDNFMSEIDDILNK